MRICVFFTGITVKIQSGGVAKRWAREARPYRAFLLLVNTYKYIWQDILIRAMEQPSEEQQYVIDLVKQGKHPIVDACAGSGKTTTVISCANQNPSLKFAMITYNKDLRLEVEDKVRKLGITNMDVYNYHSLAKRYYSKEGHTDTGIREIMTENSVPMIDIPLYNVVVADEAQDMTMLYKALLSKFMDDIPGTDSLQMMILGDKMQGLYEFKGSDIRFLTHADEYWRDHPRVNMERGEFVHCSLKMSYRITNQMAEFLNKVMLGYPRLQACRDGLPVTFLRRPDGPCRSKLMVWLQSLFERKVPYDEIAFLAGSTKGCVMAVKPIENMLAEQNIPCYVPTDETQEQLDPRVIQGKIVFSTFHAFKGRQRKYIVICGFDESYFATCARDSDMYVCPSTLYVAATRATEQMIVMEHYGLEEDRPLPFLQMTHHDMDQTDFVHFDGIPMTFFPVKNETVKTMDEDKPKTRSTTVTDLIKFIPDDVLEIITPLVQNMFEPVQQVDIDNSTERDTTKQQIMIPSVIESRRKFHEDVSDLNGTVIPLMFFDRLNEESVGMMSNSSSSEDEVSKGMEKVNMKRKSKMQKRPHRNVLQGIIKHTMQEVKGKHVFLRKHVEKMPEECNSVSEYLYMANLNFAVQERYYSRLALLDEDEYIWLTPEIVEKCMERLDETVGEDCKKEPNIWRQEQLIIRKTNEKDHMYMDTVVLEQPWQEDLERKLAIRFTARIDLITKDSIWELKCTSELAFEHKLQLILYMWIYYMRLDPEKRLRSQKNSYLFNIKTGEWLRCTGTLEQLQQVTLEILRGKYSPKIH